MMRLFGWALVVAATLWAQTAWAQQGARESRIGYLYPAGGQQGSVVHVLVGGQFAGGVKDVYVSGEGVRASITRYMGRIIRLNGDERRELLRQMMELKSDAAKEVIDRHKIEFAKVGKANGKAKEDVKLPQHPLINNLENLSALELEFLIDEILKPDNKKQPNQQIAETVLIAVTIDPNAPAGDRDLRLMTASGLTNPLCFQVGALPEIVEQEPVEPNVPATPAADLPVTLNGQIKPGDIDRFQFRAREGQQLTIRAQARHLIPFLADAVPGWFQATLALYDENDREVAFADDYNFDPDPVLLYRVPKTGTFTLEIRDALYRGREDFVYRIAIGEYPFIQSIFPLGGREGVETIASLTGWNLRENQLPLNTNPDASSIRETALSQENILSNPVVYAVDTLPERVETEPNDTPEKAQSVALPLIVNGRIGSPGDVDIFRFNGKAGDEIAIETIGRRLNSPLDSLLRLTDESGQALAWNDDFEYKEGPLHKDMGTITHHADSYIRVRLPKDGAYNVCLTDAQRHGGEAYGYRLRIGPPRPDFSLFVTPSSINARPGIAVPITIHALREDGFDGEIEISLKDSPRGILLQGATIPAGCNSIRMTMVAPQERSEQPFFSLRMEGVAHIGDRTIRRPVIPADDMMQAFLYRHLVPCRELLVAVMKGPRRSPPEIVGETPVRIPVGGTADVLLNIPGGTKIENLDFKLLDPPPGVSLQESSATPEGRLKLTLKADGNVVKVGFGENLIVQVSVEVEDRPKGKETVAKKRRTGAGYLPAIPFKIVQSIDGERR